MERGNQDQNIISDINDCSVDVEKRKFTDFINIPVDKECLHNTKKKVKLDSESKSDKFPQCIKNINSSYGRYNS